MENNLPKFVSDSNGFTHAWNKLLDWCRRNTLQSSSDILVTQNTHGTSLSLVKQPSSTGGGSWAGVFNLSASYSNLDEVLVDPMKTDYSVPFVVSSGSLFPPLCPGHFVCIKSVPVSGSARNSNNIYYPIYPTIPASNVVTVSGSLANQTFWQPVIPCFQSTICQADGTFQSTWIAGFKSGSFDLSQLPYQP